LNSIITLTTDFGLNDHYTGVMKGVILGINPAAEIVDITHTIDSYNIVEAAFRLMSFYSYFPEGAVHVVVVDPGVGGERKSIAVEAGGYFFVGPDNGVFSLIYENINPRRIVEITNPKYMFKSVSNTFHGRDIFAPAAAYISSGLKLRKLGSEVTSPELLNIPKPSVEDNEISGEIIYSDHFGNLVTNIPGKLVDKDSKVRIGRARIDRISESYSDEAKGELLAIIGSTGLLEISVNQGSAKEFFKMKLPSIRVERG
jgi:S-adenosyl-L-methionine hydrolase (adenosine-forming)